MQGFIPSSRGTFMLDVVSLAMLVVVPIMFWSIHLVRQKKYQLHKKIQTYTSIALLITILLFEVDIRMNGWKHLAEPSPYFHTWLFPVFYFHLSCAISTTILWTYTIATALRRVPSPPGPSAFSARHKLFGRLSAAGMTLTACTGWIFYWAAFIS